VSLFRERRRLPVFEKEQLQGILEKVGLLEKMLNGKLFCSFCKRPISEENFGALFIFHDNEEIGVSCSSLKCIKRIAEAMGG
jgi:hypothetical protein